MEFRETTEVPWNVEFHGTLVPPNGPSPSSIEFHGIPWNYGAAKSNTTEFHRIQWNFEIVILIDTRFPWTSVKFNGNWRIIFRLTSGSSWSYMGYSMEFRETLASTNQISPSSMEFHGTRRAPFQMTQYSFHGTLVLPNQIQLSSIEFNGTWDYCFNHYQVPLDFHLMFHGIHGTLQSPNQNSSSSMGFHGFRKAPYKMTRMFHGIPWNIPWNSMELWDF